MKELISVPFMVLANFLDEWKYEGADQSREEDVIRLLRCGPEVRQTQGVLETMSPREPMPHRGRRHMSAPIK